MNSYVRDYQKRGYKPTKKKPSVRSGDDVLVDKEDDDDPDYVDGDVSPTVPPENKKNPSNSDVRQSSSGDVVMEDMVYSYVTPNYQPQLGPFREFSILFFFNSNFHLYLTK